MTSKAPPSGSSAPWRSRAVALARRGHDRVETAHALLWLARVHARQNATGAARDAFAAARELVSDVGQSCMGSLVSLLELELETVDQPARPHPIQDGDQPSDAELRVLRLMPADLTYREMAQHLCVSSTPCALTHGGYIASSEPPPASRSSPQPASAVCSNTRSRRVEHCASS